MFAIEAIKFNHNSNSAASDALNVRKNASQFVNIPEWRRFISVNPEDSRAVYAVAPAKGKTVTIAVSLSSTNPGSAFVEVRVRGHVKARPVFRQRPDGLCLLRTDRAAASRERWDT